MGTMISVQEKLKQATVGIAGLGGLGSVVAGLLARADIGRLIIADFDKVEKSNLNRQHYFLDQVGQYKVAALTENLRRMNPKVKVHAHQQKLTAGNIPELFADADIIAECFDRADQKQMIVETVLSKTDKPIVSVSGLAGYGDSNAIQSRRVSDRFILVGDNENGIETVKLLTSSRVGIAAAHQANAIIELIVDEIMV